MFPAYRHTGLRSGRGGKAALVSIYSTGYFLYTTFSALIIDTFDMIVNRYLGEHMALEPCQAFLEMPVKFSSASRGR